MTPLQPFTIAGPNGGLQTDRKPFLLPEKAFPVLENAYCWRERVIKREGIELVGRLQRTLTTSFAVAVNTVSFNIYTLFGITETNPEVNPGSIVITLGTETYTDLGNGILIGNQGGTGVVNYINGDVTIFNIVIGLLTITISYFPNLPVMGIESRELPNINNEQTVFFDTKYAYIFSGTSFSQIGAYTWDGTDEDFFWSTNYQGADSSIRTFFVTNFVDSAGSPIRYTQNGTTYINFKPQLN